MRRYELRAKTAEKFDEMDKLFIEMAGVSLEYRNLENIALYYREALDLALRGEESKNWTSVLSAKERGRLRREGFIHLEPAAWTVDSPVNNFLFKPTIGWVRLVYPLGVPEDQFPDWKDHIWED